MYIQGSLLILAATSVRAGLVLAQRAPSSEIVHRDVTQGWSLQSSSGPTDAHSCGNGAYCPISLHCNSVVNNHQVAACCSSSSDCRGDVENAPVCADSSWNLWVGYDGNGFCCESGLIGVYDISKSVAGTCVSSENVGSLRSAVLTATGSGATVTQAPDSSSTPSSTATAAASNTDASESKSTSAPTATSGTSSKAAATGSSSSTSSVVSGAASASGSASPSSSTTPNSAQKVGTGLGFLSVALLAIALV